MKNRFIFIFIFILTFSFISCTTSNQNNGEEASVTAKLEFARQLIEMGDYRKAITFMQPLAKIEPENTDLLNLMGIAYVGNSNYSVAEEAFKKLIDIDKSHYDGYLNYGYTLILTKKYSESRKIFEKILNDGKYLYMEKVYLNYGLSYFEEKKYELAIKKFEQALMLDPLYSAGYFNLGKCSLAVGDYAKAILNLKKSVEYCTGCVDPSWELASAYYKSGQKKQAINNLENMLKAKLDAESIKKTKQLLNEFSR